LSGCWFDLWRVRWVSDMCISISLDSYRTPILELRITFIKQNVFSFFFQ